jgi:hypothetical protein
MTLPSPPKPAAAVTAILSLVLCAISFYAQRTVSVNRASDDPRLAELKTEQEQLAPYDDSAAQAAELGLGELKGRLWTDASFNRWLEERAPKAWLVQALTASDLKHLRGHRFAFQRPNSTDKDWPEIAAFLGSLEKTPGVSVQSVALGVQQGYAGSRHFSQCLFVAVFYFAGDDSPGSKN